MSRVILSKHGAHDDKNRAPHVVVGWDRPMASYYWQEFSPETDPVTGKPFWQVDDSWEEMRGFGGYMLNELPTMVSLVEAIPVEFRHWLTEDVQRQIDATVNDDSGRSRTILDLTPTSFKVEVMVVGESSWATNSLRFANYDDAKRSGKSLLQRWMMAQEFRVTPSDQPVNYKFDKDGREVRV